jgi:hypothetical protein
VIPSVNPYHQHQRKSSVSIKGRKNRISLLMNHMTSTTSTTKRKSLLIRCAVAACATLLILWMLFPAEQYDQLKEAVKQMPSEVNDVNDQPPPSSIEQGIDIL